MTIRRDDFDNLGRTGRLVAGTASRVRLVVYSATAAAIILAWVLVGLIALQEASTRLPPELHAGDWLLRGLPLPPFVENFVSLCLSPASASAAPWAFIGLAVMWFLMSVAMMLPSAAPMVRTYCEIADTAQAGQQKVVHPLVLVAGYLSVWLAASVAFSAMTVAIQAFAGQPGESATGLAAAGALGFAGLYQFSGLKEACLRKCRNPFSTLFGRWSDRPAKIYRLGLEQGLWCVGCCWALMLVMFAVGVMNVFWMALLAVFAVVEKQVQGRVASIAAGTILLVWSAALLVRSL